MLWLLSVPEIRTLIARLLLLPIAQPVFILAWSDSSRRHPTRRRPSELFSPAELLSRTIVPRSGPFTRLRIA